MEERTIKVRKKLSRREYKGYINSEDWQKTRKRFWKSKLPKCCYVCEIKGVPLDLHHRSYKSLGHENLTHLTLVCRECHTDIHRIQKDEGLNLWRATKKARTRFRKRNHLISPKKVKFF